MAKIFNPNKKGKHRSSNSSSKQLAFFTTEITDYDHELKGIGAGPNGRITFVKNAMKGEQVRVKPTHYSERMIAGDAIEYNTTSESRQSPNCEYFGRCGGCQLQYMDAEEQVKNKQAALNKLIKKQLELEQLPWQKPLAGTPWHYRRTARLALWHKGSKQSKIGFRQQGQKDIIDVESCPVLVPELEKLVQAFRVPLAQFSAREFCTHISVFSVDSGNYLFLRATKDLDKNDLSTLKHFAEQTDCAIFVENNNNQTIDVNNGDNSVDILLEYQLQELRFQFQHSDFIQINADVNQQMVEQALLWLNLEATDTVLDLFSGVGNFTLPLAKHVDKVIAVEGVNKMVARLKSNAKLNALENVTAHQADLSQFDDKRPPKWLSPIDKLLLDPARDGALAVAKKIPKLSPQEILYVSCNPVTMARDMKVLLQAGYQLTKIGLINMFPHTAHTEAMALLQKRTK